MASKKNKKNKKQNQPAKTEKVSKPEKRNVVADDGDEEFLETLEEIAASVEVDPAGEIEIFNFSEIPENSPDPKSEDYSDLEAALEIDEEPEPAANEPDNGTEETVRIPAAAVPGIVEEKPRIEPETESESVNPDTEYESAEEISAGKNVSEEKEEAVPVIRAAKHRTNPALRSVVVLACLLAASGLLVSTVHVLTRSAIRVNEQVSFNDRFELLFPDSAALREFTAEDGTTVYFAVTNGTITGYCVEQEGDLVGYGTDGVPFAAVNNGNGEEAVLPDESYQLNLTDAAKALGLTLQLEEAEETNANDENGKDEIVIGEAVEEGSETAETVPEESMLPTEIPEAAEPETETVTVQETEPETVPETTPETEPAATEAPAAAETEETRPAETTPTLSQVPEAVETETETQAPETEPETEETAPETWWTPETTPETEEDTAWSESETNAEIQWPESETSAESDPVDTDLTEHETDPSETTETVDSGETETSEESEEFEDTEISVEVEVETEAPDEEETETETQETKKAETKRKSNSGLFR